MAADDQSDRCFRGTGLAADAAGLAEIQLSDLRLLAVFDAVTVAVAGDHGDAGARGNAWDAVFFLGTDAIVILPDHIHALWTLPDNDTDYLYILARCLNVTVRSINVNIN